MDFQSICISVTNIAREVGVFISRERKNFSSKTIETKGKHDFVTHVDKGAELQLVNSLKQLLPIAGFITEEGTSTQKGEIYNWVIDPLDGTTNFIHGAPPYAISIALLQGDEVVLGVVFEIFSEECFYTWKNAAAYLNGVEIRVSDTRLVAGTLIATGFPYSSFGRLEAFMETLNYFFHNSHGVRRLGSAATDLAYVACGRYDAFYEYNLNAWDVAAGALIVQQAGGKVGDFLGQNNYIFGKEIIATNAATFDEFQKVISSFMVKK